MQEFDFHSQFLDFQFRPKENLYSTLGLRRDDHTTAGAYNTGRITMAYKLNGNSKIRSSYGTGLRYPTLYDYFYGTTVNQKEDLAPEKSKSFDIGYETKLYEINTDIIISLYKIECGVIDIFSCPPEIIFFASPNLID